MLTIVSAQNLKPAMPQEREWAEEIFSGDGRAFKKLFRTHYSKLCGFAADYVNSVDRARDIVQDVFLDIWDRRENLTVRTSMKSYLYKSVKNRALNEIRKRESRQNMKDDLNYSNTASSDQRTAADAFHMNELSEKVEQAISDLPDRRRRAFLLHRRHGFTYKEIAEIMEIAPKTVENHIGRALRFLRNQLAGQFSQKLK